jgi:hypothetical protein
MAGSEAEPGEMSAAALVASENGSDLRSVPAGRTEQLDFLSRCDDGTVVLVGTAGDPSTYRSLNGLARMSPQQRVRVHPCDAPQTLLAMTAAVMSAGGFGPGDVLEVLRSARAVTTTVAIVDRVSQLERPAPSMRQHVRSLLPGAVFVIDLPGSKVLTGPPTAGRPKRLHGAALTLSSGSDRRSLHWRDQLAARAPSAQPSVVVAACPASVSWRARSWAEVTGMSLPVSDFAGRLQLYLARQVCPSCRTWIAGTLCPRCGIVCDQSAGTGSGAAAEPGRLLPVTADEQAQIESGDQTVDGRELPALTEADLDVLTVPAGRRSPGGRGDAR